MNFAELAPHFADEDKAIELVESLMWPNGAVCPHCEATDKQYKVKSAKARKGLWKCGHCRKQYTVKVGTIFEGSHIPMTKWLMAIYMMCSSKKGVSAKQLERSLGLTYKSAWFLCHRVREAMKQDPLRGMLGSDGGIVEIDETYVGGKARNNRHKNRTAAAGKKTVVMTLVDREGEARTFVVPNAKKSTLQTIARPVISGSAHIVTDEHLGYQGIGKHFASHHIVDHSQTYVRALIFHTNFAESYHSLLKRGIVGTFHHVSEKHLSRYLREFEFRWNTRKDDDGDRTFKAIKQARGKRLMYRQPS
jgi:transposase-like protein